MASVDRTQVEKTLVYLKAGVEKSFGPGQGIPKSLSIRLVPSSFKRLLVAKNATKQAVSNMFAGTSVRMGDVKSDIEDQILSGVFLFISRSSTKNDTFFVRLHCSCHSGNMFLIAFTELTEAWFQEQLAKLN